MDNEFSGIVMFIKEHKDVDAMVKVFTKEFGKQMFFVKQLHSGTHHLKSVLVSGTRARFVGTINLNGLSFLRDYKEKISLWKQMDDILIQAYLAYFIALSDAVIEDRVVNQKLYDLLWHCLEMVHQNFDIEVVSMMFELKMLEFWHIHFKFDECIVTNEKNVPLDISFQFGGCISASEWDKDVHRLFINPNAIYLMDKLQKIPFEKVSQINISIPLKVEIQRAIDSLYDEYVGIKLKSKKYIEDLKNWL